MKPKATILSRRHLALTLAGTVTVLFSLPHAQAADKTKANNTDNLNLATSWTTSPAAGFNDVAIWTNTVAGANTVALGSNLNWQGIKIVNPGGLVTITPGNSLILGDQGINMSTATADLTIQSGLTIQASSGPAWNLASGRTLTLNTGVFARNPSSTLSVRGSGTVIASNILNDSTGIVGPWATFGTGTGAGFATISGGGITGYTGATAAATAAEVTDTTGLVNYDLAAIGEVGAAASFNTLRYTGAAGAVTGDFSANGILNSGTGALTLSGNLAIGTTKELVVTNGDGNTARDVVLSGVISDNAGGSSAVVKGGDGNLTLSGDNTYTGLTTVTRGAVILSHDNGLGSTDAGTRLTAGGNAQYSNGGFLQMSAGVTSAEPIYIDSTLSQNMIKNSGVCTLSGPVRLNNSIRPATGSNLNFTGGISTANGVAGTYILLNGWLTVTDQPFVNGSGYIAMDQGQTRIIGVAGNMWGGMGIQNGTLRTTVPNVFTAATATVSLGGIGGNGTATIDLAGNNQFVTELRSGGYVVVNQERTITSATPATLTVSSTSNVTFDGRLTGEVSLVKNHTGIIHLSGGASTTTGSITVNGGVVDLNFGRARGPSAEVDDWVSDYLPNTTMVNLGGGTLQLTGRKDGSATPVTGNCTKDSSEITSMSSTADLSPGQPISGTGIPAGAYVVSITTGLTGTGNRVVISANATATQTGSTLTPTATSSSTSQTLGGLTLNPGASGLVVSANGAAIPASVLNLGTITRTPGGTVNFTLPAGTQSDTNGITVDNTNTNGILGGWARTGVDWAVNSTNSTAGNIVPLTTYTEVTRLESGTKTVVSDPTANVRVVEGTGTAPASFTPATPGTTDIHTLLAAGTTAVVTYDPEANDVLRLGVAGGIMVASNAAGLKIGNTTNDGYLTAGGADDAAGTLYLTSANTNAASLLTINSVISDNGTGAVGVVTAGAGVIKLNGSNTYTGKTVVGGTGVYNSTDRLEISSEGNLGATPEEVVADQLVLAGGMLRATAAVTLSANRGITVTGANSQIDPAQTITVNGVIAGTGILTRPGQAGAGNLILNAANTFSGTLVTNSTGNPTQLQLGNINALQNATLDVSNTHNHSTVFSVAGTNTYNIGGLTGVDEIYIGANTLSIGANNNTTTYSGSYTGVPTSQIPNGGGIVGTGGLTKVGTGTLQLSGANTYSGDTLVSGGTLVLAHANALQNSTLDTGAAGTQSANLTQLEGVIYNLGGLKGSDELDMAVCHLSIGSNGQDTTFSGTLKGAFGNNLIKTGTGKLTLAGPATYTGSTTVNGGTLEIAADKTYAGSIAVNAGTFTLANGGTMRLEIANIGNHAISGTGTATLAGTLTVNTGGVTATTGTWTLVNMGTLAPASSFASTFALTGFTAGGDGITWTKTDGGKTWSFSETTGVLTLTTGGGGGTFASWIASFDFAAFPGADLSFTGDADQDGIANGVEFVIGNLPNQTKMENLPVLTAVTNPDGLPAGDYLKFSYRRTTASVTAGVTSQAQYDTDLAGAWTAALDGTAGVEIVETANGAIPGTNVEVFIPRTLAENGHLFGRLAAIPTP